MQRIRKNNKVWVLLASIFAISLCVVIFFKLFFVPKHPLIFFNPEIDRELSELSRELIDNIDEDCVWIDKDRITGSKSYREYSDKYGKLPIIKKAQRLLENYDFLRIQIFKTDEDTIVAFNSYHVTKTFYYYIYFKDKAPAVPLKLKKFTRKLNDHWWYGTVLPYISNHF